jgi:hypothetical protein
MCRLADVLRGVGVHYSPAWTGESSSGSTWSSSCCSWWLSMAIKFAGPYPSTAVEVMKDIVD